jgi:DNA-binding transcriptional MerR regulator
MTTESYTFDLAELAAAADVTPRTVRYYVQQGLLPAPAARGPGTRYERGYLDRLQLIRRLQREHLPLAEIRKRLDALDDDGVRDALVGAGGVRGETSALDYVRDLLARQSLRTAESPPAAAGAAPSAPVASSSAAPHGGAQKLSPVAGAFTRMLGAARPPDAGFVQQSTRSTRSTWERIPIAPDVELHVRRPLSREQNRQVERLLEAARDLFAEEI